MLRRSLTSLSLFLILSHTHFISLTHFLSLTHAQETVLSLKERACAAFGLDPSKVEIWDYFNHGKYANLEKDSAKDLEAARILDEQPILLDDVVSEPLGGVCGGVRGEGSLGGGG